MMSPERLLKHAAVVQAVAVNPERERERGRARRKLERLNKKVADGHINLKPFRDKLAAAAGER